MRVRFMIAIGVLGLALATSVTASAQGITMRWTVDGEHRAALVFPPAPTHRTSETPAGVCLPRSWRQHARHSATDEHPYALEGSDRRIPARREPTERSRSPGKPSRMAGRSKPGEHRK